MKCNAPFNNMYFNVHGKVSPCWLTVGAVDSWSKDRSISDIWEGSKFTQIRFNVIYEAFKGKCQICKKNSDEGVWPLAKAYDQFPTAAWPSLMELELSNQCNLECTMCSGELSSGIRKNRDKLPPLPMVYDESFVEQLEEFVPYLQELRINGGEPFAQKIVLDICDMVAEIKPNLKITIATNGTVYNKRVKHILENNNIHLNISIDSLSPKLYEEIRVNGDYNILMKNFIIFRDYCRDKNRSLCVMVNPMRNNWTEMHKFVEFTHMHNVKLWFNTIRYPEHLAIWNLPSKTLEKITRQMDVNCGYIKNLSNADKYFQLHKQINNWKLDGYTK